VDIAIVCDTHMPRGDRRLRIIRLRALFPTADAVVFGHSHMPLHELSPEGFQIFKPW
jgi:uncharacterized protein